MAALRTAVFPLSVKNRRGGHFLPPPPPVRVLSCTLYFLGRMCPILLMSVGPISAEAADLSWETAVRQSLPHRLSGVRPVDGAAAGLHPVPQHARHGHAAVPGAADPRRRRPGAPAAAAPPHLWPAADAGHRRHPVGPGGRRPAWSARRVPLAGADTLCRPGDRQLGAHMRRRHHQRALRADGRPLHEEGAVSI